MEYLFVMRLKVWETNIPISEYINVHCVVLKLIPTVWGFAKVADLQALTVMTSVFLQVLMPIVLVNYRL